MAGGNQKTKITTRGLFPDIDRFNQTILMSIKVLSNLYENIILVVQSPFRVYQHFFPLGSGLFYSRKRCN
mgnify:CR=1 FL=1